MNVRGRWSWFRICFQVQTGIRSSEPLDATAGELADLNHLHCSVLQVACSRKSKCNSNGYILSMNSSLLVS